MYNRVHAHLVMITWDIRIGRFCSNNNFNKQIVFSDFNSLAEYTNLCPVVRLEELSLQQQERNASTVKGFLSLVETILISRQWHVLALRLQC